MRYDLKDILDAYAADLERVTEIASLRFNQAVKAKLTEWAERYPRHAFKVTEGHGRMSVDVHPPVMGDSMLSLMNPGNYRGAVAELIAEAVALVDAFNESEQRVGLMCDTHVTDGWRGWGSA